LKGRVGRLRYLSKTSSSHTAATTTVIIHIHIFIIIHIFYPSKELEDFAMDIISQMRNSGVDIHRDVQVRNSHSQSWGSKFSWLTLVRLWFLGTTNIFCESGVFSSICWPDRMSQALRGVGVSKDLCYLEPSTS
jgi:hypothetical protein